MGKKFSNAKEVEVEHQHRGLGDNFCVAPFTTLLLEPDGKVGACRHKGSDFPVANLLSDNFEDIWNGSFIQKWRQEFLNGQPQICKTEVKDRNCHHCPDYNALLSKADLTAHQTRKPLRLAFNFNGHCNLECQMCHIWKKPNGLYDKIDFWNKLDFWIEDLEEVELLSGEPFIQRDTYRLIDIISKKKPHAQWSITTNANWKLTEYVKNQLNKIEVKNIIVSIDSLESNTYKIIRKKGDLSKALQTLHELNNFSNWRESQGKSSLDIRVNFLIQKLNWKELGHIYDFGEKNKLSVFRTFLYDPGHLSLLSLDKAAREEILNWYFENLTLPQLLHSSRVIRPLLDSLEPIKKFIYFSKYKELIQNSRIEQNAG